MLHCPAALCLARPRHVRCECDQHNGTIKICSPKPCARVAGAPFTGMSWRDTAPVITGALLVIRLSAGDVESPRKACVRIMTSNRLKQHQAASRKHCYTYLRRWLAFQRVVVDELLFNSIQSAKMQHQALPWHPWPFTPRTAENVPSGCSLCTRLSSGTASLAASGVCASRGAASCAGCAVMSVGTCDQCC